MSHEGISENNVEKEKNSIGIHCVFSEKSEIWYATNAVKTLPWFRENGYGDRNSRLPEGVTEQSSDEEVRAIVATEFKEDFYKDFADQIQEQWPALAEKLERLREIPAFKFFDPYTIQLTQYGSGGSYNAKTGMVALNIGRNRQMEQIMRVISHEIVHIGIQEFIEKYNVRHWYKEHLVDLIGARYFTKRIQNAPEDVSVVDTAFDTYFPDIEAIARAIGDTK